MSLGLTLYLTAARRQGRKGPYAPSQDAPDEGPLVWLHATHRGEIAPLQGLAAQLLDERPEANVLITVEHAAALSQLLGGEQTPGLFYEQICEDHPSSADEFLSHWSPDVLIWAGSNLRPAILQSAADANTRLILIDATSASVIGVKNGWLPGLLKPLLRLFHQVCAINETAARKLVRQGAQLDAVETSGPLEEVACVRGHNSAERETLSAHFATRPVWLAARLSLEEASMVALAQRAAQRIAHRLLLIIVPRNEDEGQELAEALRADGWSVALRSKGEDPLDDIQIYVADTRGEMGLWLRLAPTTFLGGTLYDDGAQTPLEATALGSSVIFGPFTGPYAASFSKLEKAGAAKRVRSDRELAQAVEMLLAPDVAAQMSHAAWEVMASDSEVADQLVAHLHDLLDDVEFG